MIAVTGATGHIGNVLVRALLACGKRVKAVTVPMDDLSALAGLPVEIAYGDVLDPASLARAFDGAESVYHLAGLVSIMPGREDLLNKVNVQGTRNVIQACLETGVRRLVHTSSIHALVEPPRGVLVDEAAPLQPDRVVGAYGRSKALATLEVLEAAKNGFDAVIVYPTGVIGPYDFRRSETGQLIWDFLGGRLRAFVGGGYDFVDVRDVAEGMILAWERGRSGEGYILSGEWISVRDLLAVLEELTGVAAPRTMIPYWLARTAAVFTPAYYRLTRKIPRFTAYSLYTLASNSLTDGLKARRELGYAPRPLRETLADTVAWLKETGRVTEKREVGGERLEERKG